MIIQCSPYGNYRTRKFTDIFTKSSELVNGFNATAFTGIISEDDLTKLYYLLYARYGNSSIANSDENQFKYKLYAIIWQYGPTWARNVEIQASLRALTENDLMTGSKAITNHGFNPSTVIEEGPNPNDGEITTTNDQTKTRYVKSKMEGYAMLISLLEKDVTEEFIGKFKKLFVTITEPDIPLFYESEN